MKVLVDTNALIWYIEGNSSFSKKAIQIIDNQLNDVFVSMVSFYEIAVKLRIGKLKFNKTLGEYFQDATSHDISVLPISEKYLSQYDNVPFMPLHKDPFDRLIIATAIVEKLDIITMDKQFDLYKGLINIIG
jgi:PIN domain nuclease of toxin-antitoxin system